MKEKLEIEALDKGYRLIHYKIEDEKIVKTEMLRSQRIDAINLVGKFFNGEK